jgi:hypothetical protein
VLASHSTLPFRFWRALTTPYLKAIRILFGTEKSRKGEGRP